MQRLMLIAALVAAMCPHLLVAATPSSDTAATVHAEALCILEAAEKIARDIGYDARDGLGPGKDGVPETEIFFPGTDRQIRRHVHLVRVFRHNMRRLAPCVDLLITAERHRYSELIWWGATRKIVYIDVAERRPKELFIFSQADIDLVPEVLVTRNDMPTEGDLHHAPLTDIIAKYLFAARDAQNGLFADAGLSWTRRQEGAGIFPLRRRRYFRMHHTAFNRAMTALRRGRNLVTASAGIDKFELMETWGRQTILFERYRNAEYHHRMLPETWEIINDRSRASDLLPLGAGENELDGRPRDSLVEPSPALLPDVEPPAEEDEDEGEA